MILPSLLQGALLALLASPAEARPSRNHEEVGFNPHHAHRDLMRRAVTTSPTDIQGKTYDYIVVGGGVAGLVIASRLTEMKNQTVLVIEAGGEGSDVAMNQDIPGYTYHHGVARDTPYGWNMSTVPQTEGNGTVRGYPLGRGLGGSGAINGMFWCRGDKEEYDAWGELNPGANVTWNWEEMDKYIKKAENLQMPPQETIDKFHMPIDPKAHGSGGPLQVGWSQYIFPVIENWIPTFVNLGLPSHDMADGKTRGVMITPSTIDASQQKRSDARRAYLDPNSERGNLFVLTHHQATQIFFNGTKDASGNIIASGVKFQADATSPSYNVYTAKDIIVTSGAINSPKLLQLSGVGPTDLLSKLGIKQVLDLPVGHNFQDHMSFPMFWDTVEGLETWFALGSSPELKAQALAEYQASKTGLWTYINEAVAYASMSDLVGAEEAKSVANQFDSAANVQTLAAKYNLPASVQAGVTAQWDIQKRWLGNDVGQLEYIMHLWGKNPNSLGIQVCPQHTFSRGTVQISTTDPFVMPNIDPNYFGIDMDTTVFAAAVEWIRKYAQTAPMSNVMISEAIPGAAVTGEELRTFLKGAGSTEYHPMSTCSMLPKDKGGVVDTNLIVYGTSNLRVADASIMPIHVSAHLMASTYGVAEKAADIIKARYENPLPPKVSSTSTRASTSATSSTARPSASASDASADKSSSESALTTGAKIGIGVGVAAGALLLIAAIIAFCVVRKKEKEPTNKGWYAQGAANGQWSHNQAGE